MAQQNNTTNKLTNIELSIQISLSGLSFCTLNRDTNTITFLKEINFEKSKNPFALLDVLKNTFNNENALQEAFTAVNIIHDNDLSTLVPKPLFNEDLLADYLKFNSKILKSDYITFDEIASNDSVNVYVPYININNYIYDKFGEFTFKHVSTVLIESLLNQYKNTLDSQLIVNINQSNFEVLVIENATLKLYNTFKFSTKEDFIYYILFTLEQLNLNPESIQLTFIGSIFETSELYKIAFKYIRNVTFGKRNDSYKYHAIAQSKYSNFALINSF